MTERSLPWTDATGDGGPYSQDQLRLMVRAMGKGGLNSVLPGERQEFFPYSTGNNNVTILSGIGPVDGTLHESDVTKSFTVTSPSGGTTGKRIVRRKDWTAQTIRLVEISSADGTATIPALTQTDGVTHEESVCSFTITTGGVIAVLTDTRIFPGGIAQHVHPALAAARGRDVLIGDHFAMVHEAELDGDFATAETIMHFVTPGTLANDPGTPNARGALQLTTGATSSGACAIGGFAGTGSTVLSLSVGLTVDVDMPQFAAKLHPQDSNMNASAHQEWGLLDTDRMAASTVLGATRGAYFVSEATGQLLAATEHGGVNTQTSLGALSAFNSQQLFEIIPVNIGGSVNVFFLLDREIVARHTTNLPAGTMGAYIGIRTGSNNNYNIEEAEHLFVDNLLAA